MTKRIIHNFKRTFALMLSLVVMLALSPVVALAASTEALVTAVDGLTNATIGEVEANTATITATMASGTTSVDLTATASDKATVSYWKDSTCNSEEITGVTAFAVSSEGPNTAYIKVVSEDENTTNIYTVTITVLAEKEELVSITPFLAQNAANGTTLAEVKAAMGSIVEIKTDGDISLADVTWDADTTPTYNATAAGTYVLEGTVTLPEDVANAADVPLTVTVNIIVAEPGTEEPANATNESGLIEAIRNENITDITITSDITLSSDFEITDGKSVTVGNGSTLETGSAEMMVSGELVVADSGIVNVTGTLTVKSGATLTINGELKVSGDLVIQSGATLTLNGAKIVFSKQAVLRSLPSGIEDITDSFNAILAATISSPTELEIGNGYGIEITSNTSIPNNLTLKVTGTGKVMIHSGCSLSTGDGAIENQNNGIIDTNGNSITAVGGVYSNSPTLEPVDYSIEIGDETPGGVGQKRTITISGENLAGKYLLVETTNGAAASAVVVLTLEEMTGTGGKVISYQYPDTEVEVTLYSGEPDLTAANTGVNTLATGSTN